jgi:cytochrome c553
MDATAMDTSAPTEEPTEEPPEEEPDATVADAGAADTALADAADTAVADTAVADTAVADTAVADTAVADTAVADTAVADTAPPATALPCDVSTVFSASCTGCHNASSFLPLVTYGNLTAMSSAYPGQTYAMRSVTRMTAGTMPPGGGASAADIATIQSWITAGYPHGTCGSP